MSKNVARINLYRQFSEVLGLEDTSLGIFGNLTCLKDNIIEIVPRNHHWIVVGGRVEDTAEGYDSLTNGSKTKKIAIQMWKLWQCSGKQQRINSRSVQRQWYGVDCGVFPTAFNLELVFGSKSRKNDTVIIKVNEKTLFCLPKEKRSFYALFRK